MPVENLITITLLALTVLVLVSGVARQSSPGKAVPRVPTVQRKVPGRIMGAAFITDGDGLKVDGHVIRMAGLDAPEHDQPARGPNGQWFNHGRQVKSELVRKIGGRNVEVVTHGRDRHGRVLGTVFCDGEDINQWLVLRGFAVAAYGRQYRSAERWSRKKGLGMWGLNHSHDPRAWRRRD